MARVAADRAVFSASVAGAAVADDFLYYIEASLADGSRLFFPPTAPAGPNFVARI